MASLRLIMRQHFPRRQIVLQEVVILHFEGVGSIMFHEVVKVSHDFKVLIRTSHASDAGDVGQVLMELTGEGLQGCVLTQIPEMPSLIDQFCCIVVEAELIELLVCE